MFTHLAGAAVLLCAAGLHADGIVNGNFSAGNTGFSSQYVNQSNLVPEGGYFVGTNPRDFHPSFASFGDHTNGLGNMLIVNGAPAENQTVWSETLNLDPNTEYVFSIWAANVYPTSPPALTFSVGNHQVGPAFSVPGLAEWTLFQFDFLSAQGGQSVLSIVDTNTVRFGNDFALDDISLKPVSNAPEPASFILIGLGLVALSLRYSTK